jgi:Asp/Glu/Hydantoin racemase
VDRQSFAKRADLRHRPVYGTMIGIIVLDTGFRRLPGDIGHVDSWTFPVQFAVARNVRPENVIGADAEQTLDVFYRAIDELVAIGVDGITTSCGYLSIVHDALRRYSPVPLATSSLQQIPTVMTMLPFGKTVGVLVSDQGALQDRHFTNVGAPTGLPIAELSADGPIRCTMAANSLDASHAAQEAEVVSVVGRFLKDHPDVGAIVSECANLPPYSAAIQKTFGIPVFDIVTLVTWMHEGLRPRRFAQES